MQKIRYFIDNFFTSRKIKGASVVVLKELEGDGKMPFVLRTSEAVALAHSLNNTEPLESSFNPQVALVQFMHETGWQLLEVMVPHQKSNDPRAILTFGKDGELKTMLMRAVFAFEISEIVKSPIYIDKEYVDNSVLQVVTVNKEQDLPDLLKEMPPENLQALLLALSESENYEEAAMVRDEIKTRKDNGEEMGEVKLIPMNEMNDISLFDSFILLFMKNNPGFVFDIGTLFGDEDNDMDDYDDDDDDDYGDDDFDEDLDDDDEDLDNDDDDDNDDDLDGDNDGDNDDDLKDDHDEEGNDDDTDDKKPDDTDHITGFNKKHRS